MLLTEHVRFGHTCNCLLNHSCIKSTCYILGQQFFNVDQVNLTLHWTSDNEEPAWIELPVRDLVEPTRVTSMEVPYLEPHKVLSFMSSILKTPRSHIDFYWRWGQRFGCQWAKLGNSDIIPCGMHADEAKYRDGPPQEKILAITLNFCLHRPTSIRHSRFVIFTLRSCLNIGPTTIYPLFWKLVESFHYAYMGLNPDGSQLAGGSRFLVTELRGDLDWFKQCWQFEKRGWQALDVCFFCNAKSKGRTCQFTETGPQADWISTEFTNTWEWAANVLPDRLCTFDDEFFCGRLIDIMFHTRTHSRMSCAVILICFAGIARV